MKPLRISCAFALTAFMLTVLTSRAAHANGETVNGYPNWSERVLLEWINRARSSPADDLAACPSGNCIENINNCYTPQPPRVLSYNIAHSGRFHSSEMNVDGFFDHWSECVTAPTVPTTYLSQPQQCDGTASCACTGGARTLGFGNGTGPDGRMSLFGGNTGSYGEIIAEDSQGPDATFYLWEYEKADSTTCKFDEANGHRFLILRSDYGAPSAGPGVVGSYSTVDFDNEPGTAKIPSGTHYPHQATSVDAWVNWYDTAAPKSAQIDVDGVCSNLSRVHGTATNGAWHATVSGVGTGCHRYVFSFVDGNGQSVVYPTSGSLAIGNGTAQCPDWSSATVKSCSDEIFKNGFEP